jgi:hypothetical protein
MSDKAPISILTAPVKTHYIAIGIFAVLFGLFYVFMYVDQFKDMRDKIYKWRTSIFGSKTNDIMDNEYTNEPANEIDDDIDDENDDDTDNRIEKTNNMQEVLSPF